MIGRKSPCLVITFFSTVQAMAVEKELTAQGLPGRMIPVPREITSGCGLAWKAPADREEELTLAIERAGLHIQGLYRLEL